MSKTISAPQPFDFSWRTIDGLNIRYATGGQEEGAFVLIVSRRQTELDTAVKAIGDKSFGVQGDVAKLNDLDRLYETVKAQKGTARRAPEKDKK